MNNVEFWDSIQPFDEKSENKWDPAHIYGASCPETLEDDEYQLNSVKNLLSDTNVRKNGNILDFGTGVGRIARQLSRMQFNVKTVDISPKVIEYAKYYCKDCKNIEFVITKGSGCGDIEKEWADAAVSAFCFQHMPTVEIMSYCLNGIIEVLKTGARASIQSRGPRIVGKKTVIDNISGMQLTEAEFSDLAETHGFRIIKIEPGTMGLYRAVLEKPI